LGFFSSLLKQSLDDKISIVPFDVAVARADGDTFMWGA